MKTAFRYTGAPVRRREDPRLITGRGTYVDDIKVAGALHAAFLRSPHAHARIRRIDASRAARLPGVEGIITGEDSARLANPLMVRVSIPVTPVVHFLAYQKVRYVGEAVACVAATSRAVAEDACDLIEVDYEPLPAVVDAEQAAAPGAPLLFEELGTNVLWHGAFPYGDVDGAFARADRIVRERIAIHRYASTPLETFGGIASWDEGTQQLTVWGHGQLPGLVIASLCHILRLSPAQVRFIQPQVGGAFGNKERTPYLAALAVLSRQLGRPVRYQEDRRESLMALAHSCDGVHYAEAAVRADGTVLAMRFRNYQNEGCGIEFATIHSLLMLANLVNCYRIPVVSLESHAVLTNKCPAGFNRGVGKPFMCFVIERMMDRIARELGMDRTEIRFRNFIQPEQFPYETPSGALYDSGDYPETLRLALQQFDYAGLLRYQAEARARGRLVGIGIATAIEPANTNFGYSRLINQKALLTGMGEAARIRMEWDGKVSVATGATDSGQGHETAIAQIVADELGVPIEDVRVASQFDSASTPWLPASGNYANKFSGTDTGAIVGAARKVKQRIQALAAEALEARPEDIEVSEGHVFVRDAPARRTPLRELTASAYWSLAGRGPGFEPGIEATHYYSNPLADLPDAHGRVRAQTNFANAAHLSLVEVDPETFEVKVLRYLVVHDCGKLINPLIVEGQVHGATAHGIAAALMEEFVYTDDGQFLSASFMDYLKPTAADVPTIETGHLETPSPFTPLGTKGAGEGGAVPAPACIASAVEDALAPLGVKITSLPATPARLEALVRAATPR